MASKPGVHTLSDLHDRCVPNSETGCMTWAGSVFKGQGKLWLPEPRKYATLAFAMAWMKTGGNIPDGMTCGYTCGNRLCCNDKHRPLMTRSELMAIVMQSKRTPKNMAAWTRANVASKRKLTPEQVNYIRGSSDPAPELAARFGVNKKAIYATRNGHRFKALLRGASVFA